MSVLNQKIEDVSNHSSGVPNLVQLVRLKNIQIAHINQYIWFLNNHNIGPFFITFWSVMEGFICTHLYTFCFSSH